MPNPEELADENRRIRRAHAIVAVATQLLVDGRLGRAEAERVVGLARERILTLFPGQESTYEILYGRRFQRLLDEYAPADKPAEVRGLVIPFPVEPTP